MTDTPYTPEDIDEAVRKPELDVEAGEAEAAEHGHADDFDPGSPAADAPATF